MGTDVFWLKKGEDERIKPRINWLVWPANCCPMKDAVHFNNHEKAFLIAIG